MKKVTLIIALAIVSLTVSAQERFKYVQSSNAQYIELNTNYIVVESNGTVSENYTKVMDWIKLSYKFPEEVIVAESQDQFVKMNGLSRDVFEKGLSGASYAGFYDIKYSLTIYVKADKIKFEVTSLTWGEKGGSATPTIWKDLTSIMVAKNNGKPAKAYVGGDKAVAAYLNALAYGITAVASQDNW